MAPPPKLKVSEWADKERRLSSESSAEPGIWRTDRAPYQRGILDSVNEDGVHTIIIMSSAQVGKTEFLLNIIGYFIDQDPSPIMLMVPSLTMAEAFSKDRLAPMIRDTPALRSKIGGPKSRDSGNTLLHKTFPGGHLTIVGGNSPASMASRPIRILLVDELSRLPVSAGTEGDPFSLGKKRTNNFHNRLVVAVSTPTVSGADRTEKLYNDESDKRRYFVPCLHCGEMQPFEWKGIRFDKKNPDEVWYECIGCKGRIEETQKFAMLRAGQWIAERECTGVAGFHINELYSPWSSWVKIVKEFLAAYKDPELLRVWTNTTLGETFEEGAKELDQQALMDRRESYGAEVPEDCLFLTAAVDVQSSPARLEVQVEGWGVGEENWKIARYTIHGDLNQGDIWDNYLDDIIVRGSWQHASGRPMRISATCIDTGGHYTKRVYDYCRARPGQRIFAIRGRGGSGIPTVGPPTKVRYGRDRRTVFLYNLGVDSIKQLVRNRLEIEKPEDGNCFIHVPLTDDFGEEFFDQLTAEIPKRKKHHGHIKIVWEKIRERNEAFDLSVYNYAAMVMLNPQWSALAARFEDQPDDTNENTNHIRRHTRARPPKRRKGFANSWR